QCIQAAVDIAADHRQAQRCRLKKDDAEPFPCTWHCEEICNRKMVGELRLGHLSDKSDHTRNAFLRRELLQSGPIISRADDEIGGVRHPSQYLRHGSDDPVMTLVALA